MLGFFGRQGSIERPLTSSRLQGAALYGPRYMVLSAPASEAATVGVAGATARAAVGLLKPAARLLPAAASRARVRAGVAADCGGGTEILKGEAVLCLLGAGEPRSCSDPCAAV